jgi:electron transfer flavoprotein beta subunit
VQRRRWPFLDSLLEGAVPVERVIVCIKPVPDPKEWGRLSMDPETKTLIREGIPSILNPLDKNALEAALQIKDEQGVEVVVVSMAPPFCASLLKEALAMGADRAVLISDRVYAGSDTLATARVLSAALRKLDPFDLVLCGNSTLDGCTAQVPSQLAEMLGIPNVMHVSQMELRGRRELVLFQRIEMGAVVLEAEPPLLLSFTKEVNEPRLISFLGILDAEKKPLSVWGQAELGLEPCSVGLGGSPTKMAEMLLRRKERKGERIEGSPPDEAARRIADKMVHMGIL